MLAAVQAIILKELLFGGDTPTYAGPQHQCLALTIRERGGTDGQMDRQTNKTNRLTYRQTEIERQTSRDCVCVCVSTLLLLQHHSALHGIPSPHAPLTPLSVSTVHSSCTNAASSRNLSPVVFASARSLSPSPQQQQSALITAITSILLRIRECAAAES